LGTAAVKFTLVSSAGDEGERESERERERETHICGQTQGESRRSVSDPGRTKCIGHFAHSRAVVFNLGYAYPQGKCKDILEDM
jgi:hypothetical protein